MNGLRLSPRRVGRFEPTPRNRGRRSAVLTPCCAFRSQVALQALFAEASGIDSARAPLVPLFVRGIGPAGGPRHECSVAP